MRVKTENIRYEACLVKIPNISSLIFLICTYIFGRFEKAHMPDLKTYLSVSERPCSWGWPGSSLWMTRVWGTSCTTATRSTVTTTASRWICLKLDLFAKIFSSGGGECIRQGTQLHSSQPGHYRWRMQQFLSIFSPNILHTSTPGTPGIEALELNDQTVNFFSRFVRSLT